MRFRIGRTTDHPVAFLTAVFAAIVGCGGDQQPDGPVGPQPPPPPPPPSSVSFDVGFVTYVGGSDVEEIREPVVLPDGRLLFGSRTKSGNHPTAGAPVQASHGGGDGDSFLGILSADGSRLEAGTYFGGSGMERPPYGIAVARDGDIVFGSGTNSPNIPTSGNAYRPNLHAPTPNPGEGYVCRISPDLSALRWCTYTGGGWPRGGLALDANDNVIVVGRVTGSNFSTTPGVVQRTPRGTDDAFVLKLESDGSDAIWSTILGGNGTDVGEVALSVRVDPGDQSVYVSGISTSSNFPTTPGAAIESGPAPRNGFLAKLNPSATGFAYSTLLGGNGDDICDHRALLMPDGALLCSGWTSSPDFPATVGTMSGGNQGHVTMLRPSGDGFRFSHVWGGSGDEALLSPVTDAAGNIYVAGLTDSPDLPTTAGAIQPDFGGGDSDGVLVVLSPDGSTVLYATYFGGSATEMIRGIALGPQGEVYLVGRTQSDGLATPGAFQTQRGGSRDGIIVKLVPR